MLDDAQSGRAAPGSDYTPPRITPLPDNASYLQRIRAALENAVVNIPEGAYHDRVAKRRDGVVMIHLSDPDLIEEMLVRRWRDFPKADVERRVFRPFLGSGLLTADGEDWRWKRRLAAPTFAPAALAKMAPALTGPFEELAAEVAAPAEMDVDALMVAATLRVIERLLFSNRSELDLDQVAQSTDEILAPTPWVALGGVLKTPEWLPFPGQRRQRRAIERVRGVIGATARRRRAALEAGETAPEDLTSALLRARDPETGRPLSDDDMVDMLLTLILAGHETSAHTLSWTLYCLAHQPELQDALAQEAREARPDAAADPGQSPRIEAAVKESLRLFPVAPMMGRVATKEERFGDVVAPKGAICTVPIYALHRHRRHWERPDVFDIDRWMTGPEPRRTLYMPFGAGPRICVGARLAMMETTLGLAAMLRRLRFEPCAATDCDPVHRVTLRPRDGLVLRISPRP